MALPETLQGATPRPNPGENFFGFCKRCKTDPLMQGVQRKDAVCAKVFNHYSQLNLKSRDVQFFNEVERRIREIVFKYYPDMRDELDDLYEKAARAIEDGKDPESVLRPEGIIEILADNWEETGLMVSEKYSDKFGGPEFDYDTLALVMASGLTAHLSRYEDPFLKATKESIKRVVLRSNDPANELRERRNDDRAKAIISTETGLAQSVGEEFTMKGANEINPVKKYWVGRIDDKIRDSHLGATREYNESNLINFDEYFYVNGEIMKHPRDYTASARETSNCRCYLGYVII